MERGYVKLWRKTLDSGLLTNPTALQVFVYLMLNATRNAKRMVVYGEVLDLQPGDYVTGRKKLADALNISEQNVRTAMSLLERLKIITSKSTNKYTVVSLVKWNTYQEDSPASQPTEQQTSNQRVTSGSPAGNQRVTTKQERENERKKEEELRKDSFVITQESKSAPASSPTTAPTGFTPPTLDEVREYISEKGKDVDPEEFHEHYSELGWEVKGKPMKSWKLAICTWDKAERRKPRDPVASNTSTKDTPEMIRQFRQIHEDYDDIVKGLGEAGRWDLAGQYESLIYEMIDEVRAGIPYTPADQARQVYRNEY